VIWSLIIFLAGIYIGHVISPWIDETALDIRERFNPDPSDDRNIDRNRWD
jgi:hypothetical protein